MPKSVRDVAIILVFIGGGLVILFSSSKRPEAGPVTRFLYAVTRPAQVTITGAYSRVHGIWQAYVALVGIREENRMLKEEIRRLKHEKTELMSEEGENRRLRKLLNLRNRHEFPSLVAQVIGEDAVGWYRTFFINRGSDDGVQADMAVTVPEGLVGRVVRSASEMSQVLLVVDPSFSADCRISRTRDRGVVSGSLDGGCLLRYISLKSDVKPGDTVMTSGLDGIFPRGLAVGAIETVRKGDQGLFLEAEVMPAVNFREIEDVLVMLGQQGGFDIRPGLEEKR